MVALGRGWYNAFWISWVRYPEDSSRDMKSRLAFDDMLQRFPEITRRICRLIIPRIIIMKVMRILFYRNPRKYWDEETDIVLKYLKTYKRLGGEFRIQRGNLFLDKIKRLQPKSILEVGCGAGQVLEFMHAIDNAGVVGVDFSRPLLQVAGTVLDKETNLVQASAHHLPFKDNTFDVVYTSVVLQHIPHDIQKVYDEIARVSRRYIVHLEGLNKFNYNVFPHDYEKFYSAMGHSIKEKIINPELWNQSGKEVGFFIVEKNHVN